MRYRPLRGFLFFVVTLLVLAVLGAAYQVGATAVDQRRFPPPGQLVDVGTHRLHMRCYGEGSPTLLFEAGAGGSSLDWAAVEPQIGGLTRVCLYDRAGLGWSETSPNPPTSAWVVKDLRLLLERSGEQGPFVLVAHSLGGLHARAFAAAYPDLVAGLVLVDPTNADPIGPARIVLTLDEISVLEAMQAKGEAMMLTFTKVQTWMARLGLSRTLTLLGAGAVSQLAGQVPADVRGAYKAVSLRTQTPVTAGREIAGTAASADEATKAASLGAIPLVLLRPASAGAPGAAPTADLTPELLAKLASVQDQEPVLGLSTRSRLVRVENSGHMIQLDQPAAVADAVRVVVQEVRGCQGPSTLKGDCSR